MGNEKISLENDVGEKNLWGERIFSPDKRFLINGGCPVCEKNSIFKYLGRLPEDMNGRYKDIEPYICLRPDCGIIIADKYIEKTTK